MFYFLPIFVIAFVQSCVASSCEENHKLYVDLCAAPKQIKALDFKLLLSESKPVLHFGIIGNDVFERNAYKTLKEEEAELSKNLDSILCLKAHTESFDEKEGLKGSFAGVESGIRANWSCKASLDFPGAERCDHKSVTEKFNQKAFVYFTIIKDTFVFEIDCFSNGEVGWVLFSTDPKLVTEEEKKFYYDYAESLGFSKLDHRTLFDNTCSV